jgi:hypothetical protein
MLFDVVLTSPWTSAVLAVVVHYSLFIRGEWHIFAPHLLTIHLCLPAVLTLLHLSLRTQHIDQAIFGGLVQFGSYGIAMLGSLTIYRLFFHRLRHFSGPFPARISKLWHVYKIWDGKNHLFLENIRERYGDFVRTGKEYSGVCRPGTAKTIGPNEMTIFQPDIHRLIDGPNTTCTKSAWYDVVHPDQSLVSARDKLMHDDRRRLWFQGLGAQCEPSKVPISLHTLTATTQLSKSTTTECCPTSIDLPSTLRGPTKRRLQ